MSRDRTDASSVVLATFAALVVISFLVTGVAQLTAQVACGQWLKPNHIFSGIMALLSDVDTSFPPIRSCSVPVVPFRAAVVVLVLGVIALAIFIVRRVIRHRQSDAYFVRQLQRRDGFASASEIDQFLSGKAVLKRAKQLRPTLSKPQATDVGWKVGRSRGRAVFVSIEDSVLIEGAPRIGKGFRLIIGAILDWSGPLITTSTTNDNLTATIRQREKRGKVFVFDPQ